MAKSKSTQASWFAPRGWTITGAAVLVFLNLGVFGRRELDFSQALEFDGVAIRQGELWRLLTGNLVHYGTNHFLLDVGVFLVLGLIYEPYFRRTFPWLLLTMCAAIGLACFAVMGENTRMRGLSGVDSGLFAAALFVEFGLARNDPSRWWWVAPAALLFTFKTIYETTTGEALLPTGDILGEMKLATTAHLAGVVSALLFCFARQDVIGQLKE